MVFMKKQLFLLFLPIIVIIFCLVACPYGSGGTINIINNGDSAIDMLIIFSSNDTVLEAYGPSSSKQVFISTGGESFSINGISPGNCYVQIGTRDNQVRNSSAFYLDNGKTVRVNWSGGSNWTIN
jgi:hypothetical protein